ncbi:MAG: RNA-binding cell elongation regulator Jag/EloR [Deltaproteobacteria bacterium]|nr:RNA-binding cell elongation regulator Jag/EloR [Deltaproteobacteria bacterium]
MEFLEFEGKTTEEAIENACDHFHLPAESLEIEIVSVGSPGLFGLGSKPAKVRAALREAPETDLLAEARETLENILAKMGETARVEARHEDDRITLSIESADAGLLIGKQGQTLEALQYLVSKIISKKSRRKVRLVIDIESYRARHSEALTQMALKYGEKVKKTGKPVTLNPMNPHDRRIVHLALQGDSELKTLSRGEGLYKKVVVYPVKKKEEPEDAGLT